MTDRDALYRFVGERIRAARGKQLSQDALALAVGLTRSSISNIEKGRQKLLLHTLVDIANALKVEAATLLPPRPSETTLDEPGQLARLPENERAFIEAAIGATRINKRLNGRQTKANTGTRRSVAR